MASKVLSWGHAGLTLVLVESEDTALRVVSISTDPWDENQNYQRLLPPSRATSDQPAPGGAGYLPEQQPLVEILTVADGRARSSDRLIGSAVGHGLRYRSHLSTKDGGWHRLHLDLVHPVSGLQVGVLLESPDGVSALRSTLTVTGPSSGTTVLTAVPSICLPLAASFGPRDAIGATGELIDELELMWARSDWLGDIRWRTDDMRALLVDLALNSAHAQDAKGAFSIRSTGTWSTGKYLPMGVVSRRSGPGALCFQIEHNGAWRWELAEDRSGPSLTLSGPTDIDHQWTRPLSAGQQFVSVPAAVAVGDDFAAAVAALTAYRRAARLPRLDDVSRPVIFNDYMNTLMGDPTTAKLLPLIDAAAVAGAEYFCIDAGWYDDSGDWWDSVGDWQPSTVRFPDGLREVTDHIRERGMSPGLWLEPEVVGVRAALAQTLPKDAFLQRHGQRIVEHGRFHLDLRHPAARAHLDGVVDRLVADFGVGMFKLDYNINPGSGTDVDTASVGDGLLQHNRAHLHWIGSVLERHPQLVLENCASGAMRADPAMLALMQMQSTSDQQDPSLLVPIAAAAPLAMLPEQAANWGYPQPTMTSDEISSALATTMLGRFYLSGYLNQMDAHQRDLVAEAVAAHKSIRDDLATSRPIWPLGPAQWDSPWVVLGLVSGARTYLTIWRRAGAPEELVCPLDHLTSLDTVVDTVFPASAEAWKWEFDPATGSLAVTATTAAPSARTLKLTVVAGE